MKYPLLSCCLLMSCFSLTAQVKWQNADQNFGPLPTGFHVFKTTDPLDGLPNIAYYAEIDLRNKALQTDAVVTPDKIRHTPSAFYDSLLKHPLLVVNGTFFSFATNQNLNLVMSKGRLKAYTVPTVAAGKSGFYYLSRGAIGITKSGKPDVAWVYTDTALRFPYALSMPSTAKGPLSDPSLKDIVRQMPELTAKKWKMATAIAGGPVLVQNGTIQVSNTQERMFVSGLKDRHPRTLMGYTADDKLIVMVIEGRNPGVAEGATLEQEARLLVDLGCVEGLNLDGGGSSCMLINGHATIKVSDKEGQRPVPAVFTVYQK